MNRAFTRPLDKTHIEELKADIIAEGSRKLEDFTCFSCVRQKENRCELQWDWYNTDGDCLLEK